MLVLSVVHFLDGLSAIKNDPLRLHYKQINKLLWNSENNFTHVIEKVSHTSFSETITMLVSRQNPELQP